MCQEGGAGGDEETAALKEMFLSKQAGFGNPSKSHARGCSRIHTKQKSPQTAGLSSNPGSVVFLLCLWDIL